jgi:hypothetical protein
MQGKNAGHTSYLNMRDFICQVYTSNSFSKLPTDWDLAYPNLLVSLFLLEPIMHGMHSTHAV